MESEDGDAFPELDPRFQPRASVWSEVSSDTSRPPSYDTVSSEILSEDQIKRARAVRAHGTDAKSIISTGNRPSVDETGVKWSEADEYVSAKESIDGEDEVDTKDKSVYETCQGFNDDVMRTIKEIQRQQERLKLLHAEHDKKLEELLRLQPAVNEQFQIIRQHSVKQSSIETSLPGAENAVNLTGANSNARSEDKCHSEEKESVCCQHGNCGGAGAKAKSKNDADTNNINNRGTESKHNSAPNDQVTHRKPSKHAARNKNAECEFQRLLFSEEHRSVYVQLEKLYSNVQHLHLPSPAVQTLMEGNFLCSPLDARACVYGGLLAAGGEPAASAGGIRKQSQDEKIIQENKDLKQQNEKIQRELEAMKRQMEIVPIRRNPPPIPPKPDFHPHSSNKRRGIKKSLRPPTNEEFQLNFVPGRPSSPMLRRHAPPLDVAFNDISIQHKIESYNQKLNQEKRQGDRKQVSSSFYITHGGCRAQLEVFLNGNGTGRGRCMSLFLRVVPGQYDDDIKWPVTLHIRATLINQRLGLSHSVQDKGHQFQFGKPKNCSDEDSDCWGLVEFVSHQMITQPGFIEEDSILLRCKIMINSPSN
ncbi:hypothetical protein EGW08_020057 [Elysia chlorotica]|uniref:MATH domain-containing protein n=1 Tax=Elysia chlorotica TaxID=188477 RepID=A0A433SSF5_ELYCH|nr:hypothetical protein EGW08_020057 [Elysia chlorotica]